MFDTCTSIKDLNESRTQMIKSGKSMLDINRSYNLRRKEILNASKGFVKLTKIEPTPHTIVPYNECRYLGDSPKANTIIITQEGFLA